MFLILCKPEYLELVQGRAVEESIFGAHFWCAKSTVFTFVQDLFVCLYLLIYIALAVLNWSADLCDKTYCSITTSCMLFVWWIYCVQKKFRSEWVSHCLRDCCWRVGSCVDYVLCTLINTNEVVLDESDMTYRKYVRFVLLFFFLFLQWELAACFGPFLAFQLQHLEGEKQSYILQLSVQ